MAVNVINPNKGRVYLSKEGLQLDSANLDKYHPNSNVNTLQVNIEDGGVLNTMAMINYQTPSMAVQSQAMTSHWYPLFFIGINNVKVANESGRRTFAQFLTPIPVNILNLNLGRSLPMNVKATVKLVGGVNFKGVFDSLGELQAQIPPTLELDEEYAIACVIDELGNVDYYQVDETSTDIYEWVKNSETTNPILSLLESKQYNIFNISVQGGFGNATPLPLATQHYQILWQAINNQGNAISDLDNKVDNVLSLYQNTIQSVGETPTVKPTITNDFPNGKRLELDVKISVENDLIEVESDGLKVTNAKVDERIDLKTNPIIQELNEHIEDLNNPHAVTAEQVDTYNKTTIDNKDANTLQQAKDYTYSKVEIDNKDTAIMNKANNLENANMFKDVNYNNVNGVLTFTRYDNTTKQIDLPLELLVESGYYDEVANELVLVLANSSEIRIPVGDLLTDLDAHNVRFNGSGTNYLVNKQDVESAIKELDTQVKGANDDIALRVKTSDVVDNLNSTDTDKPLSANQGKVLNDTTAKLAVSNVFTQPQQVPNATLPQHATNKLQVETMFEMFKRELRGYNVAIPNLTGKTEISAGVYRLYDDSGITIDYNITNGQYKINGTWTGITGQGPNIQFINLNGLILTVSVEIVSGVLPNGTIYRPSINTTTYQIENFEGIRYEVPYSSNNDYIRMTNGAVFNDFTYTVQIEKGSTATPYTVPGQIPQYKIVGES